MAKKDTPRNFSAILDDEPAAPVADSRTIQVNFKIDAKLKKLLDRAVYHKGPSATQKTYLFDLLAAALEADPDAHRAVPGEK